MVYWSEPLTLDQMVAGSIPVNALAIVLQQDTLSTLLLSTQVYKWVPGIGCEGYVVSGAAPGCLLGGGGGGGGGAKFLATAARDQTFAPALKFQPYAYNSL